MFTTIFYETDVTLRKVKKMPWACLEKKHSSGGARICYLDELAQKIYFLYIAH